MIKFTEKRVADSVSAVGINNMAYAQQLLLLWESGILLYARQRLPT